MIAKVSIGLFLVTLAFFLSGHVDSKDVSVSREKRDTGEWNNFNVGAPLLQDFGNGTTNNGTTGVWSKCSCAIDGCDCYTQYNDFNGTKLMFRIQHIKTHTRFRVRFRDVNNTFHKEFILVNGTSCFQFSGRKFDQVCFMRYGSENNTFLEKACLAVGVRIQQYSAISADIQCVKHMDDGTTHVGQINMTAPDLNFLANYTLYGAASANTLSSLALIASIITAIFISKFDS